MYLIGVACLLGVFLAHAPPAGAQVMSQPGTPGRFISLGVTEVPHAWSAAHRRDRSFIYLLDSATGRIEICSDVEGLCRSIAASAREPQGMIQGRFVAVSILSAPAAWRAKHPLDEHLVYSLDSATAQVEACGDMEAACTLINQGDNHATSSWPKLVMLYRRADSGAIAGRMYDRFVAHYGAQAVFMDIYSIPFATDWREQVRNMSLHGGLIVAVIGPAWFGRRPDGHTRIEDVDDPVRTELETAFDANVAIFPVLVEGATMPRAADLPQSLKKLADINAATVDTGRDFDMHMARLIASLDVFLARHASGTASK
jgi:hypothetical protein